MESIKLSDTVEVTIDGSGRSSNPGFQYTIWWTRNDHQWHFTSTVCRDKEALRKRAINHGKRVDAGKVDPYTFYY